MRWVSGDDARKTPICGWLWGNVCYMALVRCISGGMILASYDHRLEQRSERLRSHLRSSSTGIIEHRR